MITTDNDRAANLAAEFLPQRNDDERPALRVGGTLVSVYLSDGRLQVAVATEDDALAGPDGIAPMQIVVEDAIVYEHGPAASPRGELFDIVRTEMELADLNAVRNAEQPPGRLRYLDNVLLRIAFEVGGDALREDVAAAQNARSTARDKQRTGSSVPTESPRFSRRLSFLTHGGDAVATVYQATHGDDRRPLGCWTTPEARDRHVLSLARNGLITARVHYDELPVSGEPQLIVLVDSSGELAAGPFGTDSEALAFDADNELQLARWTIAHYTQVMARIAVREEHGRLRRCFGGRDQIPMSDLDDAMRIPWTLRSIPRTTPSTD